MPLRTPLGPVFHFGPSVGRGLREAYGRAFQDRLPMGRSVETRDGWMEELDLARAGPPAQLRVRVSFGGRLGEVVGRCKAFGMPCHRCPDDDPNLCSDCCPDPVKRKALRAAEAEIAVRERDKRLLREGLVQASILCDACEVLEHHGLLEAASMAVRTAYRNHEQQELPQLLKSARQASEAGRPLTARQRRLLKEHPLK